MWGQKPGQLNIQSTFRGTFFTYQEIIIILQNLWKTFVLKLQNVLNAIWEYSYCYNKDRNC